MKRRNRRQKKRRIPQKLKWKPRPYIAALFYSCLHGQFDLVEFVLLCIFYSFSFCLGKYSIALESHNIMAHFFPFFFMKCYLLVQSDIFFRFLFNKEKKGKSILYVWVQSTISTVCSDQLIQIQTSICTLSQGSDIFTNDLSDWRKTKDKF